MSTGKRGIEFVIGAVDKFTAPLAAFNAKIAESTAGLRMLGSRMGAVGRESGLARLWNSGANVSKRFDAVAAEAAALGGKLALVGGGLAYGFKKGFVDVASQFEKYETILTTLNMGDTAKSKKELGWISDFAAKTPYELAEVTEAFVQLRSYGMDPMHGLLETLGDTSSAMGKPLKQAVEAIADAVTGENERLKEFGIVGKKVGDKIVYEYTNAAGAQAKMMAKASDRAAIQATLTKIWAEKYGGGMERLSKTFGGMMSNLMDAASRFSMKVMSNGAFDWMKGKLEGILATIDRMSADGSLDAWATQWGTKLTVFLKNAWDAGIAFAGALSSIGQGLAWTADLLGGWSNLATALTVILSAKLIVALAQLAISFFTLGVAILTTPIGWITLGVVALTVGIVAACKHFETFISVASKLALALGLIGGVILGTPIGWFMAAIGAVSLGIMTIWKNWEKIVTWFKEKTPAWVLNMFGGGDGVAGPSISGGASPSAVGGWLGVESPRPQLGAATLSRQINEQRYTSLERQESKVTVDFANLPRGAQVRQAGKPVDMDVNWDMGPAMAGI